MKKVGFVVVFLLLLALPWAIKFMLYPVPLTEGSCTTDYTVIGKESINQQEIRSSGSLLVRFFSNGRIIFRYVGKITVQKGNQTLDYTVHRTAMQNYTFIGGFLTVTTQSSSRALSDNASDDLVLRYVHPGLQAGYTDYAKAYRLGDHYLALGLLDSPRTLCKLDIKTER
jgi:hypothetical protein